MAADDKKNEKTETPEGEDGSKPGGERQADKLNGDVPQADQERPANDPATKSGEYVDLRVDTPVKPEGKDMPRPTGA